MFFFIRVQGRKTPSSKTSWLSEVVFNIQSSYKDSLEMQIGWRIWGQYKQFEVSQRPIYTHKGLLKQKFNTHMTRMLCTIPIIIHMLKELPSYLEDVDFKRDIQVCFGSGCYLSPKKCLTDQVNRIQFLLSRALLDPSCPTPHTFPTMWLWTVPCSMKMWGPQLRDSQIIPRYTMTDIWTHCRAFC